jgi:Protein of unknown function (DUF2793)
MTDTPNLGLPYIEAAQAQKHVTHNESLRMLDALVLLSALDRDLSAPPASPSEGDRYLVKSPGTDAFAGMDDCVAHYIDGGWSFYSPRSGWTCYVVDESTLVIWNGAAWGDFFASVTAIQNLALLGVGTTADATNPLSAKLNNTLWVAQTVAEGGDGNLRYKLSKESAAKTLSFLFQDNFSGRAEIGLTGDDDFHFKVSPDGATWVDALRLNKTTGAAAIATSLAVGSPAGTLGAINTGSAGVWNWNGASRAIQFSSGGGANEIKSYGAALIINYDSGQNVELYGAAAATLRVNGNLALGGGTYDSVPAATRTLTIKAGGSQGSVNQLDIVDSAGTTHYLSVNNAGASVAGDISATGVYKVGSTQVLGARNTGWTAQTATPSKGDLGASPTVGQLAAWCAAMQAALTTHGVIGA